jgi:hypothetical protein
MTDWAHVDPRARLLTQLPRLADKGFEITSQATRDYNCVAWSVEETTQFWWPVDVGGYFWPTDATEPLLPDFEQVYADLGYGRCVHLNHECGADQVAIYLTSSGTPTHASRRLENGNWTSKLGDFEDIEHNDVNGVCCDTYGETVIILCRPSQPQLAVSSE